MTLDEALAISLERSLSRGEYAKLCAFAGGEAASSWDALAIGVAQRYLRGEVTFVAADSFMNALWSFVIFDGQPSPVMTRVYEAFDDGEYHHPGDAPDVDPEVAYTRPLLAALLPEEPLPNKSLERTRVG